MKKTRRGRRVFWVTSGLLVMPSVVGEERSVETAAVRGEPKHVYVVVTLRTIRESVHDANKQAPILPSACLERRTLHEDNSLLHPAQLILIQVMVVLEHDMQSSCANHPCKIVHVGRTSLAIKADHPLVFWMNQKRIPYLCLFHVGTSKNSVVDAGSLC